MNLKPFKGNVAIKPDPEETVSKAGLEYRRESEANGIGTIVAVSALSEKFFQTDVGKKVLFVRYPHSKVMLDGEHYELPKEDDVLGYIE